MIDHAWEYCMCGIVRTFSSSVGNNGCLAAIMEDTSLLLEKMLSPP